MLLGGGGLQKKRSLNAPHFERFAVSTKEGPGKGAEQRSNDAEEGVRQCRRQWLALHVSGCGLRSEWAQFVWWLIRKAFPSTKRNDNPPFFLKKTDLLPKKSRYAGKGGHGEMQPTFFASLLHFPLIF